MIKDFIIPSQRNPNGTFTGSCPICSKDWLAQYEGIKASTSIAEHIDRIATDVEEWLIEAEQMPGYYLIKFCEHLSHIEAKPEHNTGKWIVTDSLIIRS